MMMTWMKKCFDDIGGCGDDEVWIGYPLDRPTCICVFVFVCLCCDDDEDEVF